MVGKALMGAGAILLLMAILGGCISGAGLNSGRETCFPPDVSCKGTCYRPCPQNTAIDENCACAAARVTASPGARGGTASTAQEGALNIESRPSGAATDTTKPAAPMPGGLLVRYDFENDFITSGVVNDLSGSGRDGRVTGRVGTAPGMVGNSAIAFSGRGYVQAPDNPAEGRREVTFSFWFRTADPGANYKMASAAWWNGGPGSGWIMATHVPEFWAEDTDGVLVPAQENRDNGFRAGEWNHEAVTYDGGSIREYTNGVLVNTWKSRGVPLGPGAPMAIGGWPQFSGYNFIGDMDDFRIYDHALTPGEIASLFAGSPSGSAATPSGFTFGEKV